MSKSFGWATAASPSGGGSEGKGIKISLPGKLILREILFANRESVFREDLLFPPEGGGGRPRTAVAVVSDSTRRLFASVPPAMFMFR